MFLAFFKLSIYFISLIFELIMNFKNNIFVHLNYMGNLQLNMNHLYHYKQK